MKFYAPVFAACAALAATAMFAGSPAHAQSGAPTGPSAEQKQQMQAAMKAQRTALAKELGLSPAQSDKIEKMQQKIQKYGMDKAMAMQKKYAPKPGTQMTPETQQKAQAEAMSLMKEVQTMVDADMKTILTPTQFSKFKKMQADAMARRNAGGAPGAGAPAPR